MNSEEQKAKRRAKHAERMASDPVYKAKRLEHGAKYRAKNREATNSRCRAWSKNNPDYFWERDLKKSFGITKDYYLKLLDNQQGCCAICFRKPNGKRLCVDHNHSNGKIRGLLCGTCNKALGLLQDNVNTIQAAVIYLEKSH